ncbi:hypothetical protein T01_14818 [Trichinella spiralis]|uniref:Uncharacterized protein n=1 Tax=Trichinella spiralis TaxID=6334 RepID=A0A0V1C118_TRISP|nr:hypothetical protein T01_14818 [Trichinella spiralis]
MYGESSDELQIKTALSKELFQGGSPNLAKLDNHRIINGTFERAFKKSQKLFSEETVASALIVLYVVLRNGLQLKNLLQTTYRMQRMLQYYFHHIFRVTSGLRWPYPTSSWGLLRPPHHC